MRNSPIARRELVYGTVSTTAPPGWTRSRMYRARFERLSVYEMFSTSLLYRLYESAKEIEKQPKCRDNERDEEFREPEQERKKHMQNSGKVHSVLKN